MKFPALEFVDVLDPLVELSLLHLPTLMTLTCAQGTWLQNHKFRNLWKLIGQILCQGAGLKCLRQKRWQLVWDPSTRAATGVGIWVSLPWIFPCTELCRFSQFKPPRCVECQVYLSQKSCNGGPDGEIYCTVCYQVEKSSLLFAVPLLVDSRKLFESSKSNATRVTLSCF